MYKYLGCSTLHVCLAMDIVYLSHMDTYGHVSTSNYIPCTSHLVKWGSMIIFITFRHDIQCNMYVVWHVQYMYCTCLLRLLHVCFMYWYANVLAICTNTCISLSYTASGTLRPDLIESASSLASTNAHIIKTHHNDTTLVRQMRQEGRVVEPLTEFHKDEVRALGASLGLPAGIIHRHPFPGPGLAVRVICQDEAYINDPDFRVTNECLNTITAYYSKCQQVCLSVCLPVCLSVCLSVCLPVCLSVCLSVCIAAGGNTIHVPTVHTVFTYILYTCALYKH